MGTHYYPLINKVIKHLHLREGLSFLHSNSEEEVFSKPFITVSREPGSGGAPIAKLVAEKLGFEFADKEILEEIAASTKCSLDEVKEIDEKTRGQINEIVQSIIGQECLTDLTYIQELGRVILLYAQHGHCVILGRGGNFITPFANGLHVRITAPRQVRIQRAIDYEGYSKKHAKAVITKVEEERRKFVKRYFNHDQTKANAYDLTINTTYFDLEDVRDIIIKAFCHKFKRGDRYQALLK